MNNIIERIDIGISLADSELLTFFYDKVEHSLVIKIQTWNLKIVEFTFFDLLSFIDRGRNFIMDFCVSKNKTSLFMQTLEKTYDTIPTNHPYKLFQFLDVGYNPYLEIICKSYKVKLCI